MNIPAYLVSLETARKLCVEKQFAEAEAVIGQVLDEAEAMQRQNNPDFEYVFRLTGRLAEHFLKGPALAAVFERLAESDYRCGDKPIAIAFMTQAASLRSQAAPQGNRDNLLTLADNLHKQSQWQMEMSQWELASKNFQEAFAYRIPIEKMQTDNIDQEFGCWVMLNFAPISKN